ncbi:MAG: hypothetical protein O2913_12550 [Chloroflexi bacterium]|nr:hypothetical protein [Chloroflexota bacterium]
MAIENRDLEAGTKLVAKYKKEDYRAEVVAGEEGKVKYKLADGKEFKSPSSAGTAITGKACNGWAFWSIEPDSDQTESQEPESSLGEDPEDTENLENTAAAGFRRVPNQKGVQEGQVRLYCNSCQSSFTSPADQPVISCPEGHYPGEASEA